jgi:hypothetical protein
MGQNQLAASHLIKFPHQEIDFISIKTLKMAK